MLPREVEELENFVGCVGAQLAGARGSQEVMAKVPNNLSRTLKSSVDFYDSPAFSFFRRGVRAGVGERGGWFLGVRQARQRVALHLAADFVRGRRRRTAVQADPQAKQRIGERVFLLSRGDEIDVLEP